MERIFLKLKRLIGNESIPRTFVKPKPSYTIRSSDGPLKTEVINSVVTFKIQNPGSLNALNHQMIKDMRGILSITQNSEDISAYFLESTGKIFSSGGDIKSFYYEGVPKKGMKPNFSPESMNLRKNFFRDEYTLLYMISKLKKPFVSLINGPCIGAGVGLTTHCSHSIMTRNGEMSMPQCDLGFFPDVGAGYFLSCIPQNIGMFMGLTGIPFNFEECNKRGLITHSTKWEVDELRKNLIRLGDYKKHAGIFVSTTLFWFTTFTLSRKFTIKETDIDLINITFGMPTIEELMLHLREMAKKSFFYNLLHDAYCRMCKASPTSLKVTHRYLNMAKNMSLEECFKYEYRMTQNFMRHPDFYEGVRAKLIDKDNNPKWKHKFLEDVTDEMVDKFFQLPEGCEDLDVEKEAQKITFI